MSKELDDYMDAFNGWKNQYGFTGDIMTLVDIDELRSMDPRLIWTESFSRRNPIPASAVNGLDLTLENLEGGPADTFLICAIPCLEPQGSQRIELNFEEPCESCDGGNDEDVEDCDNCFGEGYLYYEYGQPN